MLDLLDRLLPNPSRRDIDDPLQTEAIRRVRDQFQIGQDILDLFSFIKLHPSHDGIGDSVLDQFVFQGPGLGIDPVKDGNIPERSDRLILKPCREGGRTAQFQDLFGDKPGLILLVLCREKR